MNGLAHRRQRPGGTTQPRLWKYFVATHCQIKLVLSGRTQGRPRRGPPSRPRHLRQPVQEILTDYQDRANGGDGWLRYYTFDPAAGP